MYCPLGLVTVRISVLQSDNLSSGSMPMHFVGLQQRLYCLFGGIFR